MPSATPRAEGSVTLGDGRRLAYAEWGPSDGTPVVLFHGSPGSRLLCPDVDETERAGVRLITIDRPGYGMSSPSPGRTLLGWAADYVEWAALVELPPCPIIGWSAGGPHALACAVHRPEQVTAVGLAASPAPLEAVPDEQAAQSDEVRELTALIASGAPGAMHALEARCEWFAEGWPMLLEPGAGGADDALLADPAVLESARAWIRESARQGSAGYMEDWVVDALPWGFSPAEVSQPTHLWWGDDDRLVSRDCSEYLAGAIKRSTLRVLAGEGHLFPIRRWREVLTAVLGPWPGTI